MRKSLDALIVEDSEDDAILVVRELRRGGYDVAFERVADAGAMRSALAARPPDIVISDYAMPQFSGLDALKVLKESGLDVPFILVSGVIGEDAGIEAMRYGAHDYLMKSSLARLVPAVERELGEAEARRKKRQAEQLVQEQAALIELAHDAIIVLDLDQKVVLWNRGAEKTYGWTKEEALGKQTPDLLKTCFPKPLEEIRTALLRDNQWEGELMHTHRSGEQIAVASRWAVQRGRRGEPIGTLEINRDITRRKRAEAELSKHLDQLEELVQARTSDLTRANQQLEKEVSDRRQAQETLRRTAEELAFSNQELEQYVYVASHDLQEPLRMVGAFVGLLRDRYGDKLDERAHGYIKNAAEGANRMSQLITDLLEYSRISRREPELQSIDAAESLATALANLRLSISESEAMVTHESLPTVRADPTQLTQLFQNLIGNAVKFRRAGVRPEVHVSAGQDGGHWVFRIRDNGIGIASEYHDRIFAVFQRLHSQREYPGTGIGLAICRKIVERLGGRIWLESKPGAGSTFYFTIPKT